MALDDGVHSMWQINKRIFGRNRWFDMDEWLHEQTQACFIQHRNELHEYNRRRRDEGLTERFRSSYFRSSDTMKLQEDKPPCYVAWHFEENSFGHSRFYAVVNMTTDESFAIRLIRYQVLAPAFRY